MNLTPKQERFIQNIVSGMSQRQAYKDAYNAENMTDESIDVEACKLFNSPNVSQRYKELLEELKDVAIMSAIERMKFLTDVVKENEQDIMFVEGIPVGKRAADLNTKMKAVEILNKMSGEYITKVEADVNNDVNITIELSDE